MANVGFQRRFSFDPGLAELTAIEGVAIIDREPPQVTAGVGTGLALVVGEFENGPFAEDAGPSEVLGAGDLLKRFGDFGFAYDGQPAQNPCARKRLADGTLTPEYWNGNGAIALARKGFRRLAIARVDTSVGEVSFTRLAAISGATGFAYDLESGQTLVFDIGAGNVTATFTGVAATLVSAAGTYPTTFAGGEWIDFAIDGTTYRATFLATDTSQSLVIARMNLAAGYTAFTNAGPGADDTTLTGRRKGTGGSVQIVAVSAALVTTATGFSAGAAVPGTGNVANVDEVTIAEANTIVTAAAPTVFVERDFSGQARIFTTAASILVDSTSTATAFGFPTEETVTAAAGTAGTIPAGTRIETTVGAREFVTMQDVAVLADSAGPYKARVRHALDDGSGTLAAVSTLNKVRYPIELGAFKVTNDLPITAALTEAQIDAAYVAALAKTKGTANVGKDVNVVFSARQSNAVRNELRQNAIDASANGCAGRRAIVRPPLGTTTRAQARSSSTQPGVGAYRSDRVDYAFPGVRTHVPGIASRGLAGGTGFTVDGVIDAGADAWLASVESLLNPEENPGQETQFMAGALGIEAGNPDVQDLTIDDYKAFRAAGICAPRIDAGTMFFQSGVNSVDPTQTALRNISRRRMADFIQDSIANAIVPFVKKLATNDRKALVVSTIDAFLSTLLSKDNPENQRIAGYTIEDVTSAAEKKLGILRLLVKVKLLGSLDVIVVDTAVGETVEITELLAA